MLMDKAPRLLPAKFDEPLIHPFSSTTTPLSSDWFIIYPFLRHPIKRPIKRYTRVCFVLTFTRYRHAHNAKSRIKFGIGEQQDRQQYSHGTSVMLPVGNSKWRNRFASDTE